MCRTKGGLSGLFCPFAQRCDFLDQERTDVTRMVFFVRHDHPRTSGSDKDKIRVRHTEAFAAVGPDLIRTERNGPVEFPDGFNQHGRTDHQRSEIWQARNVAGRYSQRRPARPVVKPGSEFATLSPRLQGAWNK